jgi:hypothetical protein
MMMSKKKGADRDTDTGVDVQPSYGQSSEKPSMMAEKPSMMNDMGEIRDEEGTLSKLRRNTETGEMYDPTGSSMSLPRSMSTGSKSKATSKATTESKPKSPTLGLNDPGYGDAPEPTKKSTSSGTYRDLSGNIKTKSADGGAADRAANREMLLEKIKSAGSSFGDYMTDLGKKEEKHGTYVKDGKVVRYAKGGMTSSKMTSAPKVSSASKRADGIASKGKTRGKLC